METVGEQYLANKEELLHTWSGRLVDEEESDSVPATFGMTDRRLLCVTDNDEFKDVGYSHISSIESESDTNTEIESVSYSILLLTGLIMIIGGVVFWGQLHWVLMVLSVLIGILFLVFGWSVRNDEEWSSIETSEVDIYTIKVITGDELTKRLVFTTEKDVAGDLSYTVRQLG